MIKVDVSAVGLRILPSCTFIVDVKLAVLDENAKNKTLNKCNGVEWVISDALTTNNLIL